MKPIALILVGLVGLACQLPMAAQAQDPDPMYSLNGPRHHVIEAQELERSFQVMVRVPEGAQADKTYPTVYLLDGGITFPLLASYYRYLKLGEEVPEMIIVGISYGAGTFEGGNYRGGDFTAPAESAAHYGGAPRLQRFFRQELIPFIEKTYPADPARRIIFGQSLGGQFVLFTAQTDPSLFWGHIASNPALHRNLPFFLQARPASGSAARVFVASGSHDDERFRTPALGWINHWTAQADKPWALRAVSLEGHGHFSAAPASFRRGLKWLFLDADN